VNPAILSSYGITAAIAEINRRNRPETYAEAEARLAEKMKPARLAPLKQGRASEHSSHDSRITDHDSR
jgi:hypothetical protein